MRHGKKVNHLGRTKSHRDALLSNMANSLIKVKRIQTTLAKAKALRMYIEPLITKGKDDSTHSRRVVFSYLQDKESINLLFGEIAEKVAERNGGYTRIIKLGQRQGDSADVALIELVDFNENMQSLTTSVEEETKGKRSRRGKSKKTGESSEETSGLEVSPLTAENSEEIADESFAEVVNESEIVDSTLDSGSEEAKESIEEAIVEDTPIVEEAPKSSESSVEETPEK